MAYRIAVSPVAVAVATEAGAFLSVDARHWRRLSPQLPFGPATSVALRERAGGLECFAVVEGRLWRIRLARAGERWVAEQVVRETLPLTQEGGGPVDLVFGVGGAETVVVLPTAFAARDAAGEPWRVLRPALPPGAHAQRLVAARGSLWLATDRGLLVASELAGPWQRVAAPAGSADVRALASDAGALYAAAGDRVLVARPPACRLRRRCRLARPRPVSGGFARPRATRRSSTCSEPCSPTSSCGPSASAPCARASVAAAGGPSSACA